METVINSQGDSLDVSYSKHPHIRTHNFRGQADRVLIYRVLSDKSASNVFKMLLNFYKVILSKTGC